MSPSGTATRAWARRRRSLTIRHLESKRILLRRMPLSSREVPLVSGHSYPVSFSELSTFEQSHRYAQDVMPIRSVVGYGCRAEEENADHSANDSCGCRGLSRQTEGMAGQNPDPFRL
jgi:hypothetical protein